MGKFYYDDGQLLNCTCNYQSGETLSERKSVFIESPTYKFNKNKTYTITDGSKTYRLALATNLQRLVFACMDYDISKDYYVNGVISPDVPKTEQAGYFYIKCNLLHCSCNYQNGERIVEGKDIVITADSGYEFNEEFCFSGVDGTEDYWFTRSKDNRQLTFTVDHTYAMVTDGDYPTILNEDIAPVKVVQKINHFVNLYQLSDDELFQLSNELYKSEDGSKDFTGNIKALYKYPLKLSDFVSDTLEPLKIGTYTSYAKGYPLNQNRIVLDLGNITVNEEYNNVYDYLNTICILHLPMFENIVLESEYVINQTIHIKYIIDMYSGKCNLEVSSSFNGNNTFVYELTKIVEDIPYYNKNADNNYNLLSTMYINNIETPFIELKRNKPYFASDDTFGKETIETNNLNDKKGFIKVNNVLLQTNATIEEYEKIVSSMKEGIIIL